MNIKSMRNVHLYLGVFFAPLLLFFIVSGCLQTFNLHEANKLRHYTPAEIVKSLSQVHMNQHLAYGHVPRLPSKSFRYLVLLMSIGLFITTVLGLLMAFKYTSPWLVWICLLGGVAVPCVLLWMASFLR